MFSSPSPFYVFVFFFLVFFEGKMIGNVVIIIVINDYRNIEWFFFHFWKFLSSCPSWRRSRYLPFTVHGSVLCLHDLPKILDCFLLMTSASSFSPLGCLPSSPMELCRSSVPVSLTPSSSSRGHTLLPQTLLWDTGTWEVWGQNLQAKTVNLYFLHRLSRNL